MLNQGQRATVLGIVGNSAAGKTTLAQGLADIIGRERCALLCADDYHRFTRQAQTRLRVLQTQFQFGEHAWAQPPLGVGQLAAQGQGTCLRIQAG